MLREKNLAEISHLRRAYFALCRELGIDDDARHALNNSLTGKSSAKDFTPDDWNAVVADLQRQNGQASQPGRPRLRSRRPPSSSPESSDRFQPITDAQIATINRLSERITWRTSAQMFVRKRVLVPMRQLGWDGNISSLSRGEATSVILALSKLASRP